MVASATCLQLQDILERIGNDQPVTLQERIDLQKFADHDQSVASWLRPARRQRHRSGPIEPDAIDRPDDDSEGWFGGAHGWVRRS
jgi:hypothetical protein